MDSARIKKFCGPLFGLLIAFSGLIDPAGAEISDETLEREHLSRYYINYASYLIDVGKYMEALESYDAAVEETAIPKTKIDALLAKAALLSSFLDAPQEALKVYRDVRDNYVQAAEIAQYREGILLFDLQRFDESRAILQDYLKAYPTGRFKFQAETLLREIAKAPPPEMASAQPPSTPPTPPPAAATAQPKMPASSATSSAPAPASAQPPSMPAASEPAAATAQPPVASAPIPSVSPAPPVPVAPVPPVAALIPPMPAPPAVERKHPEVRVRMCQTTGETRIEGTTVCVAGLGCKDRFVLAVKDGKILVNGSQTGQNALTFESDKSIKSICGSQEKRLRGKLAARIREGKLLVINIVDIEDYLLSVVPSENPATWPVESLKAQAVAARTYAYYQLLHRKDWAYDLVDFAGDQAYGGMAKEHPRSTEAVKATAGQVLTYDGKPILAMYSANSGGHTADSQAVFNLSKPYLVARRDPASLKGGMADWTRKYTVSEVVAALGKINIDADGLKAIKSEERDSSGRIIKVRIVVKDGKTKILRNRTTLRRALDLPEILHEIRLDGNTFVFEGHGWGHGVGYSQWGSAYLGKEKKYGEILSFYYGDARIDNLW